MRRRSLLVALLALVVIAGAALSIYWVWAAERIGLAIAEWTEEQRARGYDIAYRDPEIGGFPAKLSVRIAEPRITAPQGWSWSGGAIAGQAAFWRPRVLELTLPRRQKLVAPWGGRLHELALEAADARGLIQLGSGGWLQTATVEMTDLTLTESAAWTLRAERFRHDLTRRLPTVESTDDWTLVLYGEVIKLQLPEAAVSPFGRTIDRLSMNAVLLGFIPAGEPAAALAEWRDSGGLLDFRELMLTWGDLDARATGTATLDERLRPQGAFTARIAGLPEALDTLARQGLIQPAAAMAFKLSALAFAKNRDETGRTVVEVPITLQDGLFYLGPVAIFSLAPVL